MEGFFSICGKGWMRRMPLGVRIRLRHPVERTRRVPAAKLLPGFRVYSAYFGLARWHRHVPWRQPRAIQLFMRKLASSCRPTFAYLTSYFDDDTFIRFQVYRSMYFSWPAIQAAG